MPASNPLGLLTRLLCLTMLSCRCREAQAEPRDGSRPVLQGRLSNGLRYAIVPRRTREPGIGLLVRVTGGFLAERRPGERGWLT